MQGDLISRDELLKAIDTWNKFGVDETNSLFRLDNLSLPYYVPYIHYDDVIKCIKDMPSVNPQEPKYCDRNICISNEYNGISCDECEVTKSQEKSGDLISRGVFEQVRWERDIAIEQLNELGYELGQKIEPCEDAISRRGVLEQTYNWSKDEFLRVTNPFDYLRKKINSLPSVNPQEPAGHWEWLTEDKYRCSNCNSETRVDECLNEPMYEFCPFCGAKLAESEEV